MITTITTRSGSTYVIDEEARTFTRDSADLLLGPVGDSPIPFTSADLTVDYYGAVCLALEGVPLSPYTAAVGGLRTSPITAIA